MTKRPSEETINIDDDDQTTAPECKKAKVAEVERVIKVECPNQLHTLDKILLHREANGKAYLTSEELNEATVHSRWVRATFEDMKTPIHESEYAKLIHISTDWRYDHGVGKIVDHFDNSHALISCYATTGLILSRLLMLRHTTVRTKFPGCRTRWMVQWVHIPSQAVIVFCDYKGALSVRLYIKNNDGDNSALVDDAQRLLEFLFSPTMPHGYDDLIAGLTA